MDGVTKSRVVHCQKMRLGESNKAERAPVPAANKRSKKGWVCDKTLWGGEQDERFGALVGDCIELLDDLPRHTYRPKTPR